MVKCKCNAQPIIKEGKPIMEGPKPKWRHVYMCNNPQCSNYHKEIGEVRIDIFDTKVTEEIQY